MADDVKPFILNDETVENSYGFYVSTDGIELGRFEKNPVMLSDHRNMNSAVLGRWKELRKQNGQLLAVPEFDLEDEDSKKIAGKVERGFIKGASMGLMFGHDDMVFLDGKIWLKRCELVEGTIIPVPSNSSALRLYLKGQEDKPLSEEEVKSICLSLGNESTEKLKPESFMKKIMLSLGALLALGFKDAPKDGIEESEVESRIMQLSAKADAKDQEIAQLKAENETLKQAATAANLQAVTTMVDEAIASGKIPADKKEAFLAVGKADATALKATLDALQPKANLSGSIVPGKGTASDAGEIKTLDDFEKLGVEAQLAFKSGHPEEYKKLFN